MDARHIRVKVVWTVQVEPEARLPVDVIITIARNMSSLIDDQDRLAHLTRVSLGDDHTAEPSANDTDVPPFGYRRDGRMSLAEVAVVKREQVVSERPRLRKRSRLLPPHRSRSTSGTVAVAAR